MAEFGGLIVCILLMTAALTFVVVPLADWWVHVLGGCNCGRYGSSRRAPEEK